MSSAEIKDVENAVDKQEKVVVAGDEEEEVSAAQDVERGNEEDIDDEDEEEDDDEDLVEHDLKRNWTLWFDTVASQSKPVWFDNVFNVYTFSTVEDFWRLYNSIEPPSGVKARSNYYLFEEGIKPMWEDPGNAKGGKWVIEVSSHQADNAWLNSILGAIGESLQGSDQVCGIIHGSRPKKHKLSIWLKDADNEEGCVAFAKSLKEILKINSTLYFYPHDSCIKRGKAIRGNDKAIYSC